MESARLLRAALALSAVGTSLSDSHPSPQPSLHHPSSHSHAPSPNCATIAACSTDVLPPLSPSPAREEWVEPICRVGESRYVLYPIEQHDLWMLYKKHVASFWTAEEIDLGPDRKDWQSLSDDERHFLSTVLAFFAASDGIVVENLAQRFCREVQLPEVSVHGTKIMLHVQTSTLFEH